MTRLNKRGNIWHFSMQCGSRRIRGSLGTTNPEIARKRVVQLDQAAGEGQHSSLWCPLRLVLPVKTVAVLNRALLGPPPSFTLQEIEKAFSNKLDRQLKFGRLASGTVNAYEHCVGVFVEWLGGRVQLMDEVTTDLLERYFLERQEQIKQAAQSSNGRGVLTDMTAVRKFIQFCVEEKFMPAIKTPETPKIVAEIEGAEPFEADEIERMGEAAEGINLLAYLLLRWTGMRGQDVVSLTWKEIDLTAKRITKTTQKRRKLVVVPMAPALLEELVYWNNLLKPEEKDRVLPNITRDKLSRMMLGLGVKVGVEGANLHRFRSTMCKYLLEKNVSIFDAASILGDTVAVIEKYYARFTEVMQDRVRKVFQNESV